MLYTSGAEMTQDSAMLQKSAIFDFKSVRKPAVAAAN